MKISFKDDYSEGCHPKILETLVETNLAQTAEGNYGEDRFSTEAKSLIHQYLKNPTSEIHFVSGGTQANLLVISSCLRPFEAVISTEYGHIAVHETGAIESTGHKIITTKSLEGKIQIKEIERVLHQHNSEHMVKPKMVYISNSTELGTIYTKQDLKELREFCNQNDLYLFLDGARLGSALTSSKNDLTLEDISKLTDVFYVGGTKNGALLGEAIVINHLLLQPYFRYHLKQRGALLAKGRLLGIQFLTLFKDNLFFEIGKQTNQKATFLANGIKEKGYSFWLEPTTNQIFPILSDAIITALEKGFIFHRWQKVDEHHTAIRLVTSWATTNENISNFLKKL